MNRDTPQLPAVQTGRKQPADLYPHFAPDRALRDLGTVDWRRAVPATLYVEDVRRSSEPEFYVAMSLQDCPDPAALLQVVETVDAALNTQPSADVTKLVIALLFDSKTRQPANPKVYIATMMYDLVDLGFQPAVIAAACQKLRREMTFVPEIAEVIEACRQVQGHYRACRNMCQRALEGRAEAERVLQEALALGPPKPRPSSPDWNPEA